MDKFDVLLVDIQDVGLRYYTYYISMLHLMDACAAYGKKVIVLDRPNPNGFYVDGPVLDMKYKSGVGALPICTVHGMTLGELALMINGEGWLEGGRKCDLEVIPCKNYSRNTRYCLIVPPSPNLKDMKSVYLYSSTCYFEGTVVTAGRGTSSPFEVYGHPDLKGYSFSFVPESIQGAKNPRYLGQDPVLLLRRHLLPPHQRVLLHLPSAVRGQDCDEPLRVRPDRRVVQPVCTRRLQRLLLL